MLGFMKSKLDNLTPWVDKVEGFVQKVGDDLGVLDEYRYEWRRLQTFNYWPHDTPRPTEMAKAGFFYSPIPEEPDRCAHFDNDKFFSAWEQDDDPITVLRENCPDCSFLHGASSNVPLPSAYVAHSSASPAPTSAPRPPHDAAQRPHAADEPHQLGSYLSGAVQKAAGPDAAIGASAAATGKLSSWGDFAAPVAEDAFSGDADLQVTSKVKRKGKKGGGKRATGSDDGAGPKVWDFPTAVADGSEHGSEGGFTPRTPGGKEELAAVHSAVGAAVSQMKKQWVVQLETLDGKIGELKGRMEAVGAKAAAVARPGWLEAKRGELEGVRREKKEAREQADEAMRELEEVRGQVEACKEDLEKVKKAEEIANECDRKVREANEELQDLEDNKMSLEGEISELEDEKQSLKDEAEAERGRTREILQGIKAEKKAAELELVEVNEMIAMRKKELEVQEERLGSMASREGFGLSRETELAAMEKALKEREAEVAQREEYLHQKEGAARAGKGKR